MTIHTPTYVTKPLDETRHRPWPLPNQPWLLFMEWHDLLFAHWPLDPDLVRPHIPSGLTLETWEGEAWIGVVPFCMRNVHPRWVPSVPWLSHFPELNVRTYVRAQDKPGVFFFSLDAANFIAVALARTIFHLPYFNARMRCEREGDAVHYHSHRTHPGAPAADFAGSYRPTGPIYNVVAGSFEHWIIERYCLYSADKKGRIYRGDIHHQPWPIQPAEADFTRNSVARAGGLDLPNVPPLLHFSRRQDVLAWAILPI